MFFPDGGPGDDRTAPDRAGRRGGPSGAQDADDPPAVAGPRRPGDRVGTPAASVARAPHLRSFDTRPFRPDATAGLPPPEPGTAAYPTGRRDPDSPESCAKGASSLNESRPDATSVNRSLGRDATAHPTGCVE